MANRWPISSGNWSNSAIWSGSIIPIDSDDVYANNQTVTIDQNITVTSLRNAAITGVTQGGRFVIVDNYTINSTNIVGVPSACLIYTGSNGATINGNIAQGGFTTFNFISSLNLSGTGGIINISGSIPCITNASKYNIAVTTANQTINFTGSIIATSLDPSNRAFTISAGPNTYNILGNITGSGAIPFFCNGNRVDINITGSCRSTNIYYVISSPGAASTINITGSVIGPFLTSTAVHTTRINGSLSAGVSTVAAITDTSNGILIVNGPISSSTTAVGVSSIGTGATNLFTGPFYNTGSFNAVYAYRMQMIEPTSTTWTFDTETAGVTKTLYTSNQLPGVPQQTDVRQGTQYNFGLTGSLAMPDPTTVKQGVATDNTTGSAIFTAEDMFGVLTQNITTSGSIGTLLTGASTVQTVGATIASFKV
jgi:hypothetical protein